MNLGFNDVLIEPQLSSINSRKWVNLNRKFSFNNGSHLELIPIIASNMYTIGTLSMARSLYKYNVMTCLHKYVEPLSLEGFAPNTFFTIGLNGPLKDRINLVKRWSVFYSSQRPQICIDAANGYTREYIDFVKLVRERCPQSIIMAGNIVTEEGAAALVEAGADIIKVGIGSGRNCTTRIKTGVGVPQISAIKRCKEALKENTYLCSDGGCNNPGDIAKAFVAGADFVMMGGMLSGAPECEGTIVKKHRWNPFKKTEQYMLHYGMSSFLAQQRHCGIKKDYRTSEGRVTLVPLKDINNIMSDVLGGLRSTGTYIGAKALEEFSIKGALIETREQANLYHAHLTVAH